MIKKIIIITVALIVFCSFHKRYMCQAYTYIDSTNHYSVELPDNWEIIPKSTVLDHYSNIINDENLLKEFLENLTIYQQINQDYYFVLPTLIIKYESNEFFNLSEVSKIISSGIDSISIEKLQELTSTPISSVVYRKPKIDRLNNSITYSLELMGENEDKIIATPTIFLGKNGFVTLTTYSQEDKLYVQREVFQSILSSFKFHKGFEYVHNKMNRKDIYIGILQGILISLLNIPIVLWARKWGRKQYWYWLGFYFLLLVGPVIILLAKGKNYKKINKENQKRFWHLKTVLIYTILNILLWLTIVSASFQPNPGKSYAIAGFFIWVTVLYVLKEYYLVRRKIKKIQFADERVATCFHDGEAGKYCSKCGMEIK